MSDTIHPEPDRVEGAPHPRETLRLFGQAQAEAEFLGAFNSQRFHHGWLVSGLRGVGKATLAWRIARFLLATPPESGDSLFGAPEQRTSLDIASDHPVARQLLARTAAGFKHITRSVNPRTDRMRDVITAEDVRDLNQFMQLSTVEGGRRVILLDCADEMNPQAANALLKMLEEPPRLTTLLLVSHQPSRLLPTIRSRCRELRLAPLGAEDMARALAQVDVDVAGQSVALAELSGGSVGEALRLLNLDGLALYRDLIAILASLPRLDRPRALALAEAAAARGWEARFDLLTGLLDTALARLARTGAIGAPPVVEAAEGEAAALSRLAPSPASSREWARAAEEISTRMRHGRAVNLDPAALVLDTVFRISRTAAA